MGSEGHDGGFPGGEGHPNAMLTEHQVRAILDRLATRADTYGAIGADYGVTAGAIGAIASGRNWRRVPGARPPTRSYRRGGVGRKLDRAKAADIRARLAAQERGSDLAREYGVSHALVTRIGNGTRWGQTA